MLSFSNSQLIFFINLLILKAVTTYTYYELIATSYNYYGFTSNIPDITLTAINWCFYLLACIFLSSLVKVECASNWIIVLLFSISYVPCLILFEASSFPLLFFVQLHLYWFMLLIILVWYGLLNSPNVQTKIKKRHSPMNLGNTITLVLALYICIIKFNYNGFYLHFDLWDVYDLRLAAYNKSLGPGAGYLISWACLTFTIRGVYAASERNYLLVVILIFLNFIIFSIAGHKFYLFVLPLAIICSLFYRGGILIWVPFIISTLLVLAVLLDLLYGIDKLKFILPFRNMFLPSLITGYFFDFFANNSPDFLAQSVLRRFGFVSDYAQPIPYLIDRVYGDGTASANTGLSADAVSNFGLFGVIIYAFLFSFVLKLFDYATRYVQMKDTFGFVIFFAVVFLNQAFFTAMLSGGFLFMIFYIKYAEHTFVIRKNATK